MVRTTLFLLACFVLAQADKQIIGLLAVDIQQSFQLSNTQLGFLQGGAFALAFAIGGLPVAQLIDRGNRVRIAAICVTIWSVATLLCGFAGSFVMLLLFRAATAVAEAGLPPAAFSIFSQQTDRRHVARMTGIFMLAPFIGAGLMFSLGGLLVDAARGEWSAWLYGWEPWRIVFLAVGLPGLLLAPLLGLLGREPPRTHAAKAATDVPTYRQVFAHIFVARPSLRFYYLAMTAFYAATAAVLAWYPTLLVKTMGLSLGKAGLSAGIIFLAGGVAGTLVATAYFSSRRDLNVAAIIRVFLILAVVMAPVALSLPLVGSVGASLAIYAVFAFCSAAVLAIMPVPMQLALDDGMLARGAAILSLLMSAGAGTAGPLLVGVIMDVTGQPLPIAMAAVLLSASALAILFFALSVVAKEQSQNVGISPST